LEVKRLRDALNARAEEVFALENRKLHLDLSMKEREKEIEVHREVQRAELKNGEEARHRLAMDLKERQIKVEKLKRKYETIAGRLQKADEEEHSQAYYIIAAAQEREELQREGDELNRAIKLTEREIRMLTSSLGVLNERNLVARQQGKRADMTGEEAKLKSDLEAQHSYVLSLDPLVPRLNSKPLLLCCRSRAIEVVKTKQREVRDLAGDIDYQHARAITLERNIAVGNQQLATRVAQLNEAKSDEDKQRTLLDVARRAYQTRQQEYRREKKLATSEEPQDAIEMRIAVEVQERKNQLLVAMLEKFTTEHPDLEEQVASIIHDLGVKMTPRPISGSGTPTGGSSARRPLSSRSDAGSAPVTPKGHNGGGIGNGNGNGGEEKESKDIGSSPAVATTGAGATASGTSPSSGRRTSRPGSASSRPSLSRPTSQSTPASVRATTATGTTPPGGGNGQRPPSGNGTRFPPVAGSSGSRPSSSTKPPTGGGGGAAAARGDSAKYVSTLPILQFITTNLHHLLVWLVVGDEVEQVVA
jgi:hypothetical protein